MNGTGTARSARSRSPGRKRSAAAPADGRIVYVERLVELGRAAPEQPGRAADGEQPGFPAALVAIDNHGVRPEERRPASRVRPVVGVVGVHDAGPASRAKPTMRDRCPARRRHRTGPGQRAKAKVKHTGKLANSGRRGRRAGRPDGAQWRLVRRTGPSPGREVSLIRSRRAMLACNKYAPAFGS